MRGVALLQSEPVAAAPELWQLTREQWEQTPATQQGRSKKSNNKYSLTPNIISHKNSIASSLFRRYWRRTPGVWRTHGKGFMTSSSKQRIEAELLYGERWQAIRMGKGIPAAVRADYSEMSDPEFTPGPQPIGTSIPPHLL
jgi:hypothetical protein